MKKWKILNDSDKQSQNSSKQLKNDHTLTNQDPKNNNKGYIPLKRTKNISIGALPSSNPNIHILSTPRAINSEKELYLPVFSHRYIKHGSGSSNGSRPKEREKLRTEWEGIEMDKNFEDIQDKFMRNSEGMGLSQRGGSTILKRKEDQFHKYMSQRQTERHFFKEPSINNDKDLLQNQIETNFKRKHKSPVQPQSPIQLKILRKTLQAVSTHQKQLKQHIKKQLTHYSTDFTSDCNKILQKLQNNNSNQKKDHKIHMILQQYQNYRPKIEELEQQKQVFLQTLIRMSPI